MRCLRKWQVAPDTIGEDNRTLFQEICGLLEFYICDCISYGPNNLVGWWSDGVIHLEIANPEADRFTLVGVTWIDSLGIALFGEQNEGSSPVIGEPELGRLSVFQRASFVYNLG